jgi:hypothetical protein
LSCLPKIDAKKAASSLPPAVWARQDSSTAFDIDMVGRGRIAVFTVLARSLVLRTIIRQVNFKTALVEAVSLAVESY